MTALPAVLPANHCGTLISLRCGSTTAVTAIISLAIHWRDVLKYMLVSFSLSGLVLLYFPCANPTSTDACVWNQEPAVAQAVATELLPFQERGDWDGALQVRAMLLRPLCCGVCCVCFGADPPHATANSRGAFHVGLRSYR